MAGLPCRLVLLTVESAGGSVDGTGKRSWSYPGTVGVRVECLFLLSSQGGAVSQQLLTFGEPRDLEEDGGYWGDGGVELSPLW